jgi:FkbM family methyltransferase
MYAQTAKSRIVDCVAYLLSFITQLTEVVSIRRFVIHKLFEPYVGWRRLNLIGKTNFGLKMHLVLPDSIQTSIFMTGEWEPAVSKIIADSLEPADIFIDVGANIGWHTLLASKIVGTSGKVYAIEASPGIFLKLKKNVDLNRIDNVKLMNVAASNGPGKVQIWTAPEGNLGHSTIVEAVAIADGHSLEADIPCDTLASLIPLADLLSARMIKIDIEGAERLAIEGVENLMSRFSERTEWLIELSPSFSASGPADADWIFGIFINAGYRAYQIKNEYGPLADRHIMKNEALKHVVARPLDKLSDLLFTKLR